MGCHDNLSGDLPKQVRRIEFPGTDDREGPWGLYNELIDGIPEDIAVLDYARGLHWSYLNAECGAGVSFTVTGGAKPTYKGDLRGRSLREVARLAKSWCFDEATLGVAALNAWYGQPKLLEALGAEFATISAATQSALSPQREAEAGEESPAAGAVSPGRRPDVGKMSPGEQPDIGVRTKRETDAFEYYRPAIERFSDAGRRARVVVVGHFPHVEAIADYADLVVLERNCRNDIDTPDSACEYVVPSADFAFFTGVTLINKTAPRLLALADRAEVIVVGPSAVASHVLFDHGVSAIAGRAVVDPERVRFSIAAGTPFGDALRSFIVRVRK